MDYEVFLISRIHEEWQARRDARAAVGVDLARTGRVITAAAAVMIAVFGAFAISARACRARTPVTSTMPPASSCRGASD